MGVSGAEWKGFSDALGAILNCKLPELPILPKVAEISLIPAFLAILAFLAIYLGAHLLTANAMGNPTRTVCRIGPVMIDAGSNLGGQRWMAESGTTTQFIISQTNSP